MNAVLPRQGTTLASLTMTLIAVGLYNVAAGVVPVCVTVGILQGTTAGYLGAFLSVRYVPLALVVLFGGLASERVDRRNLLRWSLTASAAAQGICAVSFGDQGIRMAPLLLGLALSGLAAGFVYPAFAAEVAARGAGPQLRKFNSAYRVASTVGTASGAAVGGALVSLLGVTLALAVSCGLVVVSVIVAEFRRKTDMAPRSLRSFEFRATVQALTQKWFVGTLIFTGCINVLWSGIFSVSLPVLMGASEHGVVTWTWVLTANSAGFACGGVIAGMIRPQRPLQFATLCLLGASVLLALLVPSRDIVACYLPEAFFAGAAVEQVNLNVVQTQQERGQSMGAGLIASVDLLAGIVTSPLGLLVGGYLVVLQGGTIATLLLSAGVAVVSVTFLSIRPWRRTASMSLRAAA